jgi:hypothetical protein
MTIYSKKTKENILSEASAHLTSRHCLAKKQKRLNKIEKNHNHRLKSIKNLKNHQSRIFLDNCYRQRCLVENLVRLLSGVRVNFVLGMFK